MTFDFSQFIPILPALVSIFAPQLTELTKRGVVALDGKIPPLFKPAVSVFVGAILAGLVGQATLGTGGASGLLGGLVGAAGATGFSQGKKS